MKYEWKFDLKFETWMVGTPTNGCGVYKEVNGYYGNVVTPFRSMFVYGPFVSIEECMNECEKQWEEICGNTE
jgi:hypothetical protein